MTQLERSIEILQHIGFRIRQGEPNAFTYHLYSPIYNKVYDGTTTITFFYCLESKNNDAWANKLREFIQEKSKNWNVFHIILDFPKVDAESCYTKTLKCNRNEIDYSIMCQSYDHCNYFTDGAMGLSIEEFNDIFLTEWRDSSLTNILTCQKSA